MILTQSPGSSSHCIPLISTAFHTTIGHGFISLSQVCTKWLGFIYFADTQSSNKKKRVNAICTDRRESSKADKNSLTSVVKQVHKIFYFSSGFVDVGRETYIIHNGSESVHVHTQILAFYTSNDERINLQSNVKSHACHSAIIWQVLDNGWLVCTHIHTIRYYTTAWNPSQGRKHGMKSVPEFLNAMRLIVLNQFKSRVVCNFAIVFIT